MGAEGDHGEDGLGDIGNEAGEAVAEFSLHDAVKDALKPGSLGGQSGIVAEGFGEDGQSGGEIRACLVGKLTVKSDGLGDLGDGVGVVEVYGWVFSSPSALIQALSEAGAM